MLVKKISTQFRHSCHPHTNIAYRLAYQATGMLNEINKLVDETGLPFHNQFRLELRPASFYNKEVKHNLWELKMNIDPTTWFDLKWKECGDSEQAQQNCLGQVGLLTSYQFHFEI